MKSLTFLKVLLAYFLLFASYATADDICGALSLPASPHFVALKRIQDAIKSAKINRTELWTDANKLNWAGLPKASGMDQIFYPFGGADVLTPAWVGQDVKKIVAAQLYPFGDLLNSLDLWSARFAPKFQDILFHQILGMLSSGRLADANDLGGGLGFLALMEIEFLLDAEILDIRYLSRIDSEWQEFSLTATEDTRHDHGKITFRYQGRIIDYYLIRADLADTKDLVPNYPAYRSLQVAAQKSKVGANEVFELIDEQRPFLSFLKAIHQGKGRLSSDFSSLFQLVQKSKIVYSEDNPIAPFVLKEKVSRVDAPLFGENPLQIWQHP